MDILSKKDDEIYELAKPIWDNLVRSSNLKDYGGFTKDFSTQMLFGANEVELGKQWANNKIITNLKETFEPFGCLRRGIHVTVLIKQTNKEISGEFLGRLVLGVEDDVVPLKDSQDVLTHASNPVELFKIEGADHVFDGSATKIMCQKAADWLNS